MPALLRNNKLITLVSRTVTNRLSNEKSLYLRKHAHNPVDWWPWHSEALQLARELDRPIFLSVGYSSCHWCTVMEQEAFSDLTIARYLNDHYIAIKVDREERPDLDSLYMQALQLIQEQGGWPLNIFLDPGDLVPFYGGTYFPVEPRYGRPGFLRVLEFLYDYYKQKKTDLQDRKLRLMDTLSAVTRLGVGQKINPGWVTQAIPQISSLLAGGPGPSFPMLPHADFLLRLSRLGDPGQTRTLERGLNLALGGIFDQVGGGFHRYTVDPTWTVPHFEKMLSDNGQILEYLAHLWSQGHQEPSFRWAIARTVAWLKREMTAPQGYFYASQDADSEGEEGKFYVWTLAELQDTSLETAFTVTAQGNFEHGTNVLQRKYAGPLTPEIETALDQLLVRRQQRIPPATDPKLILAWNSLQISGLCRASLALGEPEYLTLALTCAQFIHDYQHVNGQWYRVNYNGTPAVRATAEDYSLWVKAQLDLFEATQDPLWLDRARAVQQQMDLLWDPTGGGYFSSSAPAQELILREKDTQDNSTPAANGIAAQNLLRLFALTDDPRYLKQAEQTLLAVAQLLEHAPRACPSLLAAVDLYGNLSLVQTFTDQPELLQQLQQEYHPTVVFRAIPRPEDSATALALVCKGTTCLTPATTLTELRAQLAEVTGRTR